ncbi:hypothetical protein PHLGIDRAFT_466911 [Phlebiopsis gigantea 11061_1 CR5-6]|uniref:Proteophosphoglycan 5 n=1 Tax=Phlebiopsis gigantea (strain 11061_1 CR5-6) TaxID=745531 RepID=A0A0C3S6L8_PHLG1|nr:hypothetical protein PHLGIDRAFT_466911 [Phlebiopsis gigantea 11061_1 CR5-6]
MLRSRSLRQTASSSEALPEHADHPQPALSSEKPNGSCRVSLIRAPPAVKTPNWSCRRILRYLLASLFLVSCWLSFPRLLKVLGPNSVEVASQSAQPILQVFSDLKHRISSAKFAASPPVASSMQQHSPDQQYHGALEPERPKVTKDSPPLRWPPMITAVPEVPPSSDATRVGVTNSAIDSQFCSGGQQCRILLPLWIGEQESRGRMHLTQLVQLAASLNRTFVLPNVGKSRLGTCGKWSFEAYYNTGSIAKQLKEVSGGTGRVMLMDDFRTWLDMRPDSPSGQMVFFQEDLSLTPEGTLLASDEGLSLFVDHAPLQLADGRLKNAYCMKTKYRGLSLNEYHPLSLYLTAPDPIFPAATASGDVLSSLLKQSYTAQQSLENTSAAISEPDVLVVHWDLRHMPFTPTSPLPALEYSEKLWQMARRLTSAHGPYLAVHWRMETVEPAVLPDCAEALVDTLSTLLADPTLAAGVRTVWLATDVPWSGSTAAADALVRSPAQRSNTFKAFTDDHFEAIAIVKAAFASEGPLEAWRLTGLGEQIQRLRMANKADDMVLAHEDDLGMLWEDSGIWGILDKTAAMDSALFVSGARGCGRVRCVEFYYYPSFHD